MANVVPRLDQPSNYKDSRADGNRQAQYDALSKSTTLYVGNLSFYTTEEQIYELFSKCAGPEEGGGVKRINMGLDRNNRFDSNSSLFLFLQAHIRYNQDTLWILFCRVLYPRRGSCMHAVR